MISQTCRQINSCYGAVCKCACSDELNGCWQRNLAYLRAALERRRKNTNSAVFYGEVALMIGIDTHKALACIICAVRIIVFGNTRRQVFKHCRCIWGINIKRAVREMSIIIITIT